MRGGGGEGKERGEVQGVKKETCMKKVVQDWQALLQSHLKWCPTIWKVPLLTAAVS